MARILLSLAFTAHLVVGACPSSRAEAPEPVKFTCFVHGPTNMTLSLAPEAAGEPTRKLEVIGEQNPTRWRVTIDGADKTPQNGGKLAVRPGDTITWKVVQGFHGVVFADRDAAKAMLEFVDGAGKELDDRADKFPGFGPRQWGTTGHPAGTTLAEAKVKKPKQGGGTYPEKTEKKSK